MAVFSDKIKANAYKKERCGNDKFCTIEVIEFTLNNA
jgi:hypothetical protein